MWRTLAANYANDAKMCSRHSCNWRLILSWQTEREYLARVAATADGNDNVLIPVQHVGHWRAALTGRHINRTHFFSAGLVVGTQHCAATAVRHRNDSGLTGNDQRFGNQGSNSSRPPGARNVHTAKGRVVANVVWCVAVGNLPHDLSFIEIDRRDAAVGGFYERESLNSQPRPGALSRGGSGIGAGVGTGAASEPLTGRRHFLHKARMG